MSKQAVGDAGQEEAAPSRRSGWPRGPRGSGDTIYGRVEEGARGVAVGKNIVQVGAIVVPAGLVVILIVMLLGSSGVAVFHMRGDTKMPAGFNIAVAQFAEKTDNGALRRSQQAEGLKATFSQGLKASLKPCDDGLAPPLIWDDSLSWREKSVRLGVVRDNEEAARLARKVNADVVIYANLTQVNGAQQFIPKFYARWLAEGSELLNVESIGDPIEFRGTSYLASGEMTARTRELAWFVCVLMAEMEGDPGRALGWLDEGPARLGYEVAPDSWTRSEECKEGEGSAGREILFYFKGREAYLAGDAERALAEFDRAIACNPDYARAYLGRGNVYVKRAEQQTPQKRLQAGDLERALEEYQAAQGSMLVPGKKGEQDAYLPLKVALGLSRYYRMRGYAHLLTGERAQAVSDLEGAVNAVYAVGEMPPDEEPDYLWEALENHDLAITFRQLGYATCLGYGPDIGMSHYRQAQGYFQQCVANASERTKLVKSQFVDNLIADCQKRLSCITECFDESIGGENACDIDACYHRCATESEESG